MHSFLPFGISIFNDVLPPSTDTRISPILLLFRIEPSLGTLDLSTGVHDVDPKMVTSTAVKSRATLYNYEDSSDNAIPTSKEEIEASPMLSKDKNVSKPRAGSATKRVEDFGVDSPLPSKLRDRTSDVHVPLNSLELELNLEEYFHFPLIILTLVDVTQCF